MIEHGKPPGAPGLFVISVFIKKTKKSFQMDRQYFHFIRKDEDALKANRLRIMKKKQPLISGQLYLYNNLPSSYQY